ncbi:MAG: outer membrane protein assembly factor BamA [Bacteriovoracaceae bacterium]|nr:outer membrane protein assembly factor BamA [Bacteriovoracaceae bacterium]
MSAVFALLVLSQSAFAVNELGPKKTLFKIDKIKIVGNKKVESEAITEKIISKVGASLDNYVLKNDIQRIYALKYFDSVEAHHTKLKGKNILIFKVKEKPIISRVVIIGNDEVDSEDLLENMKSKEFSILDINTIKNDVKAMEKFYEEKGYYLAAVNYDLRKVSEENTELVFKVKEYDKVKVKKVIFLGNSAFNDVQLKSVISTREEHLFSFMDGSGNFKEFNFQADMEMLKYFYRNKGYLQINVGTPEITVSEDKKWVFITIKVNEGPEFSINKIGFRGEIIFKNQKMEDVSSLSKGDIYSEEKLRKDITALTELYQDEGYAFANVLRTIQMVPGENKVNVEFSFEKGKIAHFGKIIVKGNTRTRDKVIRRELEIEEGKKYSGSSLRISKQNVNRLGFFEPGSVVFNTVSPPGQDDVLDVEISVKERNTGQVNLGAGYSTSTKFFLQGSIAQKNFMGYGQNLSFSLSLASTDQTFNVGFTDPYFLDSKWTAGGDIFRNNNSQSYAYSYKRQGFDLRIGYPIMKYTRLFATYKFEETTLSDVNDLTIDETLENGISSSIRTTLRRDKRNNAFEPSGGHYINTAVEYAGLGGSKKWSKVELDARYYKKVWGDLVLRSRFYSAKLIDVDGNPIPQTEKFSLGGARNLRGFNYEDIGPKKSVVDPDSDKLVEFSSGGLHTIYGTLEFEHPLAREAGLKWVLFMDVGNVYENVIGKDDDYSMYADFGVGFRWFSPIGVLRFEFGKPINNIKGGDDGMKFHFDIGPYF